MPASFPLGLAYCGAPPDPDGIWTHWRLDPVVLTVLALGCLAYFVGCRRLGNAAPAGRQRALFYSGWAIVTLALVSPLCPLSVSLFTARATQHVTLTLLGAPLVAAALPLRAWLAGIVPQRMYARTMAAVGPLASMLARSPFAATAAFAACVWTWHTPGPYDATFLSTPLYWCMHVTMFATACWLWSTLLGPAAFETHVFAGVLAGIASSVQMGLLGALITLSPRALYAPHFETTAAWGMTPLQDQQLGGVVMWVPGCTVFLVVAMIALARCLTAARRGVRIAAVARMPAP